MPADRMPSLSLVAVPGKRRRALDLVPEIERRGFAGIFSPSIGGDVISQCLSMGHLTERIPFGSSIQPIYLRPAADLAQTVSYITEVCGDHRFHLGLGVSHAPVHQRLGITVGKPLADTREYVATLRQVIGDNACPPIVLATLRTKMLRLAVEIADGAVWANASLSHMGDSLAHVDRDDFFIGNMIPTVIDDDRDAARAINRRTLSGYVALPNYRNYWKEAGYVEEMEGIEKAMAAGDRDAVKVCMTDAWLDDSTLSGSVSQVRDGIEAWFDAGVKTPIIVPSSTSGGQLKAVEEVFAAYA